MVHNILLQRLHEEICGCEVPFMWFESYLTGRKQAIAINNTSSSESDLKLWGTSPAAKGGNLAKIPPNQVIADFGRGSSVESESE